MTSYGIISLTYFKILVNKLFWIVTDWGLVILEFNPKNHNRRACRFNMGCILCTCSWICEAGRIAVPGRPGVCRQSLGREAFCWWELDWRGDQESSQTEKAGWWVTLGQLGAMLSRHKDWICDMESWKGAKLKKKCLSLISKALSFHRKFYSLGLSQGEMKTS